MFFFSAIRPHPGSTLFPYTTLFRSSGPRQPPSTCRRRGPGRSSATRRSRQPIAASFPRRRADRARRRSTARSEEHTSELQSPCNLVCRLLLEKKKNIDESTYVQQRK